MLEYDTIQMDSFLCFFSTRRNVFDRNRRRWQTREKTIAVFILLSMRLISIIYVLITYHFGWLDSWLIFEYSIFLVITYTINMLDANVHIFTWPMWTMTWCIVQVVFEFFTFESFNYFDQIEQINIWLTHPYLNRNFHYFSFSLSFSHLNRAHNKMMSYAANGMKLRDQITSYYSLS